MAMLLMGLCVSFFSLALVALAFGAATRRESSTPTIQPALPTVKVAPARFFAERAVPPIPQIPTIPRPQVPIEVLLQQIENHVRLEQAAAESFVEFPTHAHLYSKTTSSFVN